MPTLLYARYIPACKITAFSAELERIHHNCVFIHITFYLGQRLLEKASLRSAHALRAHVHSAQREKTDAHVVSFFNQIYFAPPGAKFFSGQSDQKRAVRQQDRGQAVPEVPMPRLMVKRAHAAHRAEAPAKRGEQKQRLFRHAPLPAHGAAFVDPEGGKRRKIHQEQINRQRKGKRAVHFSSAHNAAAVFAASSALL